MNLERMRLRLACAIMSVMSDMIMHEPLQSVMSVMTVVITITISAAPQA